MQGHASVDSARAVGQTGYKLLGRETFNYDFPARSWIAQCTQPAVPLTLEQIAIDDQRNAPRYIEYDCLSAWLYGPPEGRSEGAYLLHGNLFTEDIAKLAERDSHSTSDPFLERHLGDTSLEFTMPRYTKDYPAFAVFELSSSPVVPGPLKGFVAPAATKPASVSSGPLASTIALDGPLMLVGVAIHPQDGGLDIESWWEVVAEPSERSLSIMAHLIAENDENLGVADGLGISPSMLRQGDLLVQRHHFTETPADATLWLRLGAYWLDSMERWRVIGTENADAIFVAVEQ